MDILPITNPFYLPFFEREKSLAEVECVLRQYYTAHPQAQPELPHKFHPEDPFLTWLVDRSPVFREISQSQLGEAAVIAEDLDIAIFRHLRFLPALLHTHEFFEVVFVLDGQCCNHIGNREITMLPGDVCIIAPGTEHTIAAFRDECIILNFLIRASTFDATFLNVVSDMDIISDFFLQTLYGNHKEFYLLFHTGQDAALLDVTEKLLRSYHGASPYRRKLLNLHMSLFFLLLMQNHGADVFIPNPKSGRPDTNFMQILQYLQANYLTLSLQELAARFHYSQRQMSRILRDYTGMNFSENIQKLRMERAAQLLSSTGLSIVEIAQSSGYTNITHFRQIFQKYYHMLPTEFRNLVKK